MHKLRYAKADVRHVPVRPARKRLALGAAFMLALATTHVAAQMSEDVHFAPGDFGTMLTGEITGDAYFDHRLSARAGQEMAVDLFVTRATGDGTIYFNILPPGSDGVAIYVGAMDGNTARIDLPSDGTYAIRVYHLGNDAATGARTGYRIDLSVQ